VAIPPLFRGLKTRFGNRSIPEAILVTVFLLMLILVPIILLGGSLMDAVMWVRDSMASGKSIIPPPQESVKEWPVIDNVLKPFLLGRGAPVPMLVVFLGAIGGFIGFGIIGLFLGAVIPALGYDLFLVWLNGKSCPYGGDPGPGILRSWSGSRMTVPA
jgi:predicted PurR-regulated permease PerM